MQNILNVHWSVMRGKTIYTKIYIKCPLVCYEEKKTEK